MPLYQYRCERGHEVEMLRRGSTDPDVAVPDCPCGAQRRRLVVHRVAVIGQAAVPPDDRSYRQEYAEYREAVAEVSSFYQRKRADGDPVREPDYYGLAKAQAAAQGAVIRG